MKITHTSTKAGVIVLALRELIRKSKITDLKKYREKIDLDIDLEELRDRGLVLDGQGQRRALSGQPAMGRRMGLGLFQSR